VRQALRADINCEMLHFVIPSTSVAADAKILETQILPWLDQMLDHCEKRRYEHTSSDATHADLMRQWASMAQADAPGSTLGRLRDQLSLNDEDVLILTLAAAPYLDTRFRDRYRELQHSVLAERCTVALALDALRPGREERLAALVLFDADRPVFRHALVTLEAPAHTRPDAFLERILCVPQRTIDLLLGTPRLADNVRSYCAVEDTEILLEQVIVPDERKRAVLALVRHHAAYRRLSRTMGFVRAIPYGRGMVILFSGPPGTGKTLFARALAHELKRPLFRVFSDKLAETEEAIESVVLALFRDALLYDAIVFFDECEALLQKRGTKLGFLLTELERFEGIVLLATNTPQLLDTAMDRRIVFRMDFDLPTPLEREQIWELHLPPQACVGSDVDIPLLANLFNFTGGTVKNAVIVALNRAIDKNPEAPVMDMEALRGAAASQLRYNLEDYAQRSKMGLTMADVVLPETERTKVDEVLDACRIKDFVQNKWGLGERLVTGRGISVLFDGPPGTGKTLCAEVLARELDRPLFRVHVPNVVSKWVGETEKNISEIFTRAKATQAVLLFDEADSLFSKRTEVKSSNDRYSNQEVNLLLQELERYDGVVILTTNLFGGLDDALKRRIAYRVTFALPGPAERARIWETLMPRRAPIAADVNYEKLAASYEFAGGHIKNAIVRASYRACAAGSSITMAHLTEAARLECASAGMIVREPQAKVTPGVTPLLSPITVARESK